MSPPKAHQRCTAGQVKQMPGCRSGSCSVHAATPFSNSWRSGHVSTPQSLNCGLSTHVPCMSERVSIVMVRRFCQLSGPGANLHQQVTVSNFERMCACACTAMPDFLFAPVCTQVKVVQTHHAAGMGPVKPKFSIQRRLPCRAGVKVGS